MNTTKNTDPKTIAKRITRDTWTAIETYKMVEEGDKIMVCLSGGKDSYTLLNMLIKYQQASGITFDIVAVNLDQKQPGFPEDVLPNYLHNLNIPYKIVEQDTYSVVKDKIAEGKTTCSLCSRLRRGRLYATAKALGANKLALGHHRDDIIETFFLNLFFGGKIEAMPPKYKTDDGQFVVIRPLSFCKEKEIEIYATDKKFPIIPCNLCGSQPKLQRQLIKQMIQNWDQQYPNRSSVIFKALQNISPTHLLDTKLFDFETLKEGIMVDLL